ncbi:hypothetical protein J3B02_004799, partial [Coemansia erecta]
MFCKRCGDIVDNQSVKCRKCGGMPVEPIAGASSSSERKDPWSSTYLQKRLKPTASAGSGVSGVSARPSSSYVPSTTYGTQDELSDIRMHRPSDRPLTGSPKMRSGLSSAAAHRAGIDNQRYLDPQQPLLGVPRTVRDATAGTRPTSMYAGAVLDSQVQSAIQRSVAPQQQTRAGATRLTPPQPERQLRSKWSQYFTSTAAASPQASIAAGANGSSNSNSNRGRSESLSSSNIAGGFRDNSALYGARVLSKQNGSVLGAAAASPPSRPFVSSHRPTTSDGAGQTRSSVESSAARRLGISTQQQQQQQQQQQPGAISRNYELASPRSISSVSNEPRNVMSSFDTRKPSGMFAGSPLLSSNIRSRSATLPDLHVGESRPCTTCGLMLRSEEQRQFASKQGIVYCTDCYHSSYSRGHCAGCKKIVLTHGRPWVQYGDKVWHKLCIKCCTCSKLLMTPL